MKIYLIAGEPSGDLLGSRLMRALREKNKAVQIIGLGGDSMEREGLKSLFDISDLAIMGLAEVIPSIPKVLRRINEVVEDIINNKPDVIVSIDSWSFSARVHKKLRGLNLGIPQVHYVAPQVWAWKKKRAKTMHHYIDKLLTLLPQEPKYFTPHGMDTIFVGHPVIESNVVHGDEERFRSQYNIPQDKRIIAVLPGSRHNEVSRLLPVFLDTAKSLLEDNKDLCFVIPTVKTVAKRVRNMLKGCDLHVVVVDTEQDRYDVFDASEAAIAASGTVALELAMVDVPHIVAYKVSPISAMIARMIVNIQFVNLSNILLGREIVPELLQEQCIVSNIKRYVLEFLSKGDLYEKQMDGFKKVRHILGMGEQRPSERAADEIIKSIAKTCAEGVSCIYDEGKRSEENH